MVTRDVSAEGTSKFVQAGNVRIHYHDVGTGDVIVCLHGGGPGATGWSNYQRNIADLSATHRLLVVDLPGFGQSDRPVVEGSRLKFNATVLRDMLDALDIPKAHFLGNSFGGGVTLRFAMEYPERAARLVLMGAFGGLATITPQPTNGLVQIMTYYNDPGPSREKLRRFLNTLVYDSSWITDEVVEERYNASIFNDTPETRSRISMEDTVLWKRLSAVTQKTLIIWGRDDQVMTLDNAFIMLNQLADARLHVLPQCGHWAQFEKADEFNVLVRDFLQLPA